MSLFHRTAVYGPVSAVTIFDGLMFTFSDGPYRHAPVT